jgi:hypothetical protein
MKTYRMSFLFHNTPLVVNGVGVVPIIYYLGLHIAKISFIVLFNLGFRISQNV